MKSPLMAYEANDIYHHPHTAPNFVFAGSYEVTVPPSFCWGFYVASFFTRQLTGGDTSNNAEWERVPFFHIWFLDGWCRVFARPILSLVQWKSCPDCCPCAVGAER
ncbi:hypothetical protein JTE90_003952 [Oedothorax gibbosus]|uniref:Uncharacterized protein n=1 Tax=Oedothorax gibbosus TaxID=931172 RepID=A0AAV6UYS7_9ARAC|nr:hypothetical protein JTE90_003952 [Oedothorax gibbosus]